MLVEIPDPMVILGIVLGFLAGAVALFLYSKLRLVGSLQNNNPSDNQRLEYYEKQFIDMKIRLDALNLDNEEPLGEDEMVKIQSEMVKSPSRKERRSRVMVEKQERVDLRKTRARHGAARGQVLNVIAHRAVEREKLAAAHALFSGISGSGPAGTMPFGLIRS